jgi:putative flippase GtrA
LNKVWLFVKTRFLTRKFLTFGIIGVINTLIDALVYGLFFNEITAGAFLSKSASFIVASVFSYFANAFFTFKPESRNAKQFFAVMLVFLVRLVLSGVLAAGIDYVVTAGFGVDYAAAPAAVYIAPFFSSALMIPVAYFALDAVFRKCGRDAAE